MNSTPSIIRDKYQPVLQFLRLFALLYVLMLIYLTLFPFRFELSRHMIEMSLEDLEWWPFFMILFGKGVSISDTLVNTLIFIPLGFAAYVLFFVHGGRRVKPLLATAIAGLLLTLGIEVLQIFNPKRITSVNDLTTNTLGCFIGGWLARRYMAGVLDALVVLYRFFRRNPVLTVWHLLVLVQALIALSPLNFNPKVWFWFDQAEIWATTWTPAHFEQHLLSHTNIEVFLFGNLLCALLFLANRRASLRKSKMVIAGSSFLLLFYPGLALVQLFLHKRPPDSTFLFVSLIGVVLGLYLFTMLWLFFADRKLIARAVAVLYLGLAANHFLYPFHFALIADLPAAMARIIWLPFDLLRMNLTTEYLLGIIRNGLLALPLGFVIARRRGGDQMMQSLLPAGLIALALSLLIETVQIAIPGQTPDITEVLAFAGGAIAGALLEYLLRQPPAPATTARTGMSHPPAVVAEPLKP